MSSGYTYDAVVVGAGPNGLVAANHLADRGWSASHVLETHFHNDYVSGGLELARRTGAEYVVPSGMDIAFTAHQVSDKAELSTDVGLLRVLLTPGHTPNHLSYAVNVGGTDLALFTGGSMLYGCACDASADVHWRFDLEGVADDIDLVVLKAK